VEIFNLKKLKQFPVISNRSGASEKLNDAEDLNGVWKKKSISKSHLKKI
jgi:hypothetical protein